MGKILVTGGTGFIGSHTCVALINAGYQVVIMDNLCNSKVEAVARIEMITGRHVRFYRTDMRDEEDMRQIFEDNKIDAVIHFAGLKAVGESVEQHQRYPLPAACHAGVSLQRDNFLLQCNCLRLQQ